MAPLSAIIIITFCSRQAGMLRHRVNKERNLAVGVLFYFFCFCLFVSRYILVVDPYSPGDAVAVMVWWWETLPTVSSLLQRHHFF